MPVSINPLPKTNQVFVIACLAAAAITFSAYAAQIFNQFYFIGAPAYDAGWFAYLLSHFDFPPANPLYIQERGIPSFFSFHVAPIMPLWGALAGALGLSPTMSFALFQGFFHALVLLAGAGIAKNNLSSPWNGLLRVFVGLSLAFSPIALDTIRFPHHELAFPVLFIVTCLAWSRGRIKLAALTFVLTLFVRTDAGFHAACFLLAFAAAELITKRQLTGPIKISAACGIVAFLYSVFAFAVVQFWFPQFSNFSHSYSGNHFDHLNAAFYGARFVGLLSLRPELFAIFLVPLGIGLLKRDLAIACGSLAIIPWVALHLAAFRDIPGQLYTYYGFPFLIVVAWPWLVPLIRGDADNAVSTTVERRAIGYFVALCLVGWFVYFVTPFSATRPNAEPRVTGAKLFVPQVDRAHAAKVVGFAAAYERLMDKDAQTTFIDDAMLSLLPSRSRTRLVTEPESTTAAAPPAYVVAYFKSAEQGPGIQQSRYRRLADTCFEVPETNIRLLARGTADLVRSELGEHVTVTECSTL